VWSYDFLRPPTDQEDGQRDLSVCPAMYAFGWENKLVLYIYVGLYVKSTYMGMLLYILYFLSYNTT
jgi:hypothetical protein